VDQIDFAFSYLVFQHIPSREVIESYFREVALLLRPGSLFKVQMQRRPEISRPVVPGSRLPLRWRLTGKIPLPIRKRFLRPIRGLFLPKPESDKPNTWTGIMLTPDDAQALCDNAGFELRHERVSGEGCWLWCFKK
jgi:hypothetical protein